MTAEIWRQIGLYEVANLEINTLGSTDDRARYRDLLVTYFQDHSNQLDEDSQRRLTKNPLRILDTKNPDMAELVEQAPKMVDSLSDEAKAYFDHTMPCWKILARKTPLGWDGPWVWSVWSPYGTS